MPGNGLPCSNVTSDGKVFRDHLRRKCLGAAETVEAEVDLEIHVRMYDFGLSRVLLDRFDNGFGRVGVEQSLVFGREFPRLTGYACPRPSP